MPFNVKPSRSMVDLINSGNTMNNVQNQLGRNQIGLNFQNNMASLNMGQRINQLFNGIAKERLALQQRQIQDMPGRGDAIMGGVFQGIGNFIGNRMQGQQLAKSMANLTPRTQAGNTSMGTAFNPGRQNFMNSPFGQAWSNNFRQNGILGGGG